MLRHLAWLLHYVTAPLLCCTEATYVREHIECCFHHQVVHTESAQQLKKKLKCGTHFSV